MALLVAGCLWWDASVAAASTLGVPGEFATIQSAVDNATSGDTVAVQPGTYTGAGNRDIDLQLKDIALVGVGGAGQTVIDCEGSMVAKHRGIRRLGTTLLCTVRGLTIRNGYHDLGGGILGSGSGRIIDCVIEDCSAVGYGGGIDNLSGEQVCENTTFRRNVAAYGGGVNCGARMSLVGCRVQGNSAVGMSLSFGGGIGILHSGRCDIQSCVITGNYSAGAGGGVACVNGSTSMTSSTIAGNRGLGDGGGVFLFGAGPVTCEGLIVFENCGSGNGDEVYVDGNDVWTTATFDCTVIDSSEVRWGAGGVVQFSPLCSYENPDFCGAELCAAAPVESGDYRVSEGSPALLLGQGCDAQVGAPLGVCAVADGGGLGGVREASDIVRYRDDGVLEVLPRGGGTVSRVAVIDIYGRSMANWAVEGTEARADSGGRIELAESRALSAGVYFVRLTTDRGDRVVKLVVVK